MTAAFALICAGLLLPVISSAQSAGADRFRARIDALADQIARSGVVGMDVLEIPAEVATRARITPEFIEKVFHFRLTIADIRSWHDRPALIGALKSLSAAPFAGNPDLRWAVIFSDLDHKRIEAIYFDGTGAAGVFGTDTVSFQGGFFKWLSARFLPSFQ